MNEILGEHVCFLCGRPYGEGQKHLVADVESGRFAAYVDCDCFERIRSIRRASGGSMFSGLLELSERFSVGFFGVKRRQEDSNV